MNATTIPLTPKKSRGAARIGNGKRAPSKKLPESLDESKESHLRLILGAMVSFRNGDFSVRLPGDWMETEGQIAGTFNQVIGLKADVWSL